MEPLALTAGARGRPPAGPLAETLASPEAGDFGYGAFMAGIGALLMGRRTYDVGAGFEGDWPYGDRPVLVATHRPLTPKGGAVRVHHGSA